MKRTITDIIIHEADTPDGKEFHVDDIDQWHIERKWHRDRTWVKKFNPDIKACGYHYVIPLDGALETGRHVDEIGAHCVGHNAHSLGICLIGKGKYTDPQWACLGDLLVFLKDQYPYAAIHGHREYDTAIEQGKTCPDFDVEAYVDADYVPEDEHRLVLA